MRSFAFAFFRKMILLIPLLYLLPALFPGWGVLSVVLAEPVPDILIHLLKQRGFQPVPQEEGFKVGTN